MKNATILSFIFLSFHVFGQDTFNNGIDRLVTFEPFVSSQGVKVYSHTLNSKDKKFSAWYLNPRIGFFLFKNAELGISGAFNNIKSDFPQFKTGKAYSLGYFMRYHLSYFNFWQGTNSKGKKYTLSGKPFVEFGHEFTTLKHDSDGNYYFSESLSSQWFIYKLGVKFKIYRDFYFNTSIIYSHNTDYKPKKSPLGTFLTLGYTLTKKRK